MHLPNPTKIYMILRGLTYVDSLEDLPVGLGYKIC